LEFNRTVINGTNFTYNGSLEPGIYQWRMYAYDGYNFTNYTVLRQAELIYARINISGPENNKVLLPAASQTITVSKIENPDFITNVTIQIKNDGANTTLQATSDSSGQDSTWSAVYTVPSTLTPRTLEVIAFAYNGTVKPVNASLQMLITRAQAEILRPIFLEVCSYPSTMSQNATGNITVKADLDTLIKTITTQIDQPNGTTVTLTQDNNASDLASFTNEGTNVAERAPSAKTLRNEFGIRIAIRNASDKALTPNNRTCNISLTSPRIRLIKVNKEN